MMPKIYYDDPIVKEQVEQYGLLEKLFWSFFVMAILDGLYRRLARRKNHDNRQKN